MAHLTDTDVIKNVLGCFNLELNSTLRDPRARDITPADLEDHLDGTSVILQPGDHIAIRRCADDYIWHHGIVVNHKEVVAMNKKAPYIEKRGLAKFLGLAQGHANFVVIDYSMEDEAAGLVHSRKQSANYALEFAELATKTPITYKVLSHNCESFATLCRCGRYAIPSLKNSLHQLMAIAYPPLPKF